MKFNFMGSIGEGWALSKRCGWLARLGAALWLIFSFCCFAAIGGGMAAPERVTGRVVGVIDGDTVDVMLPGNSQVRLRLAEIDAPEKSQPWGQRAKQALSALIYSKSVQFEPMGRDRYGRTIARLYVNGRYVNLLMVEQGMAWAYRQYMTDANIGKAEDLARAGKVGLWAGNPSTTIAPWEWRHGGRASQGRPFEVIASGPGQKWRCGTKRYCRQMTSCAEARFFLVQCGELSLDGDHDGIPCETLCRR